jgi:hypothetical protein
MKYLFFLTLAFLISSCNKDNDLSDSPQLFRTVYDNTSWEGDGGEVYTFTKEKLFYIGDNASSVYYIIGSYDNIEYDGCIYDTVDNLLVLEDDDTFVIRQVTSLGSSCPASSVKVTFQVLNANTIEVSINRDGLTGSFSINKINNFSIQNAVDGTSIGWLW